MLHCLVLLDQFRVRRKSASIDSASLVAENMLFIKLLGLEFPVANLAVVGHFFYFNFLHFPRFFLKQMPWNKTFSGKNSITRTKHFHERVIVKLSRGIRVYKLQVKTRFQQTKKSCFTYQFLLPIQKHKRYCIHCSGVINVKL